MKNLKKRLLAVAAVAVFGVASISPFVVEAQSIGGDETLDAPAKPTRGIDRSSPVFDPSAGEDEPIIIIQVPCKPSLKKACYTKK